MFIPSTGYREKGIPELQVKTTDIHIDVFYSAVILGGGFLKYAELSKLGSFVTPLIILKALALLVFH